MKKILMGVLLVVSVSVFGIDHGLITGFEVGYNILNINTIENNSDIIENNVFFKQSFGYRIGIFSFESIINENFILFLKENTTDLIGLDILLNMEVDLGNLILGTDFYAPETPVKTIVKNNKRFYVYLKYNKEW